MDDGLGDASARGLVPPLARLLGHIVLVNMFGGETGGGRGGGAGRGSAAARAAGGRARGLGGRGAVTANRHAVGARAVRLQRFG